MTPEQVEEPEEIRRISQTRELISDSNDHYGFEDITT